MSARRDEGEDVTEMMASVVKSTPNWAALPPDVPPHVVTLIQRCLEKDRGARIGDIAVARFLVSDHAALGASPAPERSWDISSDGQRFLLVRAVESSDKPITAVHVVLNWKDELTRLVK